jgi:hypothetical protein
MALAVATPFRLLRSLIGFYPTSIFYGATSENRLGNGSERKKQNGKATENPMTKSLRRSSIPSSRFITSFDSARKVPLPVFLRESILTEKQISHALAVAVPFLSLRS